MFEYIRDTAVLYTLHFTIIKGRLSLSLMNIKQDILKKRYQSTIRPSSIANRLAATTVFSSSTVFQIFAKNLAARHSLATPLAIFRKYTCICHDASVSRCEETFEKRISRACRFPRHRRYRRELPYYIHYRPRIGLTWRVIVAPKYCPPRA